MIRKIILMMIFCFAGITFLYSNALDIPFNYSAKMNGMAGAGLAHVDGGTAIAVNPAGLAHIKKFETELTLNNMYLQLQAPANGIGSKSRTKQYYPLGFFGMSYRLNDIFTVGFLLYSPSGGGSKYTGVNFGDPTLPRNDFTGALVFLEFGPSLAINLPYGLKLGIVYRINYVEQWANTYDTATPGMKTYNNVHLSGYGYTGVRVGIQYNPIEKLHIGLVYRTPVTINTSGYTQVMPVYINGSFAAYPIRLGIETTSQARYAEKLCGGITYEFIKDKFLLSFDYERAFYSRYKTMTVKTQVGRQVILQRSKDTDTFRIGSEIWITTEIPFRCGAGVGTGYANKKYHNLRSSGAPGAAYYFGVGSGYRFKEFWEFNFAIDYMINKGTVGKSRYIPSSSTQFAVPGHYKANGFFAALEIKYKI